MCKVNEQFSESVGYLNDFFSSVKLVVKDSYDVQGNLNGVLGKIGGVSQNLDENFGKIAEISANIKKNQDSMMTKLDEFQSKL